MAENVEETIKQRFSDLVFAGEQLVRQCEQNSPVEIPRRSECISWLLSAVNLLEVAMPADSRYRLEAERLLPAADTTIWPERLATILGILKSAAAEWPKGLINSVEFRFIGLAFEDFLHHAAVYNEDGRKMEAAVLASAVLEDTVKKLCQKHNLKLDDKTLDSLISALKTHQIVGKVKAERLRSYAALRNKAFHAEWDAFDKRDLHQMIEGLEELLEAHFG